MDSESPIETVIVPRTRALAEGIEVRRVLPWAGGRMVGPFIFFDQMGPITLGAGQGLDVRPHPHIGLATVTYLFAGEILHRDSLGTVQSIQPGAVNWMTAGRGIAHSERTPPHLRTIGGPIFGIQSWVALPIRDEETAPAFVHVGAEGLPRLEDGGARLRLIAGAFGGARSPVPVFSEMFYVDAELAAGARVPLPTDAEARAFYVLQGRLELGRSTCEPGQMVVVTRGAEAVLRAVEPTRALLLGGAILDGQRHIWWNFVSSSKDRIEQAKADWKGGRFVAVPGETEFIPLPDGGPSPPVRYP